jgi:4-hydroxy-3-polyprenylbenzoate decarboxylase
MLALARMGAIVAPPVPPFYLQMVTIEDMVRQIAARLVNWAGVDPGDALKRWKEETAP